MQEQVDTFSRLLDESSHEELAFVGDVDMHRATVARLGQVFLANENAFDAPAVCGNGVLERAELCAIPVRGRQPGVGGRLQRDV